MKKFFPVLLALFLAFAFVNPSAALMVEETPAYVPPDLENLVVFGDSLSDSGNVFSTTLGETPDTEHYYQGRWSNGPVWSEDMAALMAITNTTLLVPQMIGGFPPITAPVFFNNAFGGAQTGPDTTDFLYQVAAWTNTPITVPEQSLVVVWIGANDFLGMGQGDDPNVVANTAVNNIATGITSIIGRGADHIAVCNLPNLGATPLNRGTANEAGATALTQGFNAGLAQAIQGLAANFSQVTFYPIDVYSMFEQAQENPAIFGVTNVTQAALLEGEAFNTADNYLFWDSIHPTKKAHEQLAALIYGNVFIGATGADYIKTRGTTGGIIGVAGDNGVINSIAFANAGETSAVARPENLLYGLMEMDMTLNTPGDVARIVINLPAPLPRNYSWYKYIDGQWVDFKEVYQNTNGAEGAQISADRKQVTLLIQDDGAYDADKTPGVVSDPIAAGIIDNDDVGYGGDSSSGCFVRSSAPARVWPLAVAAMLLALGLALRVRRSN